MALDKEHANINGVNVAYHPDLLTKYITDFIFGGSVSEAVDEKRQGNIGA